MTFSKILVPVDFSDCSTEAIRLGSELARRFEAKLTLLHVFQPFSYVIPDGYVLYSANQLGALLSAFDAQLASAKKEAEAAGAPAVTTTQLQGVPAQEISDLAKAEKFDLIVMGTHGRTGLQHVLLGSVAERVVRHAECPVLTVRQAKPHDRR